MKKEVYLLRYDKLKQRDVVPLGYSDGENKIVDRGEVMRQQIYIKGQSTYTPKGSPIKVKTITEMYKNKYLCYEIVFEDGQELNIYPTPPFDVAYDVGGENK